MRNFKNNFQFFWAKIIEIGQDLTELKSNVGLHYHTLWITAEMRFIFHKVGCAHTSRSENNFITVVSRISSRLRISKKTTEIGWD